MLLLDTDILIDLQRKYAPAMKWFASLHERPGVPGLVVMELVQNAQNKQQVQDALNLTSPFPVHWPSEADCKFALAVFAAFHTSHRLGLLDSPIGACAVGLSATLCTFNVKHFKVIPGLVTLQPYKKKATAGKKP